MADRIWKEFTPRCLGTPINFFDPSIPSMIKGCDGEVEEKKEKEDKNSENSSPLSLCQSIA